MPSSDLALFARDPLLTKVCITLFQQETIPQKTYSKPQELPATEDPSTLKKYLVENIENLAEAKSEFYNKIYNYYPFLDIESFEKLFTKVIIHHKEDGVHAPFVMIMSLLILCLTNVLAINASEIFRWAESMHLLNFVCEENLACFLYLKLYSLATSSLDSSSVRLDCVISTSAKELGLYSEISISPICGTRNNLWMGCYVLLAPHTFEEFYSEQFTGTETPLDMPLFHEYNFQRKVSKVWRCLAEDPRELKEAVSNLRNFYQTRAVQFPSDSRKVCELSLSTLELNLSLISYLHSESTGSFFQQATGFLKTSFDRCHDSLLGFLVNVDHRHPHMKFVAFAMKTLASYLLGVSCRLHAAKDTKLGNNYSTALLELEATELLTKFMNLSNLWGSHVSWCREVIKICNSNDFTELFQIESLGNKHLDQFLSAALSTNPTDDFVSMINNSNCTFEDNSPTLSLADTDCFNAAPFNDDPYELLGLESLSSSEFSLEGSNDFETDQFSQVSALDTTKHFNIIL